MCELSHFIVFACSAATHSRPVRQGGYILEGKGHFWGYLAFPHRCGRGKRCHWPGRRFAVADVIGFESIPPFDDGEAAYHGPAHVCVYW